MMEDVGGSEGVLEYTQVDGCPNADHAEQVVRTAATNHGAWWNQPFVGDEVQGLLRYSETTAIFPLIQRILKDRWGELKRLVSDPSQGDRWSDMPMEAEVVDAFGEPARVYVHTFLAGLLCHTGAPLCFRPVCGGRQLPEGAEPPEANLALPRRHAHRELSLAEERRRACELRRRRQPQRRAFLTPAFTRMFPSLLVHKTPLPQVV